MNNPPLFPVDQFLPEILETLKNHSITILEASPGAGKSTRVPLFLLEQAFPGSGKIVMLEPRRVAARSIANFLATQLGEKVGQQVGYHIRNERVSSKETKLEIVTEGILTRRIQDDPELSGTSLIIFDEFHERSVNADISLTFAQEIQQALRDDLKILVMSATLDVQKMSDFFGGAPIISCPGKVYPVETFYLDKPVQRDLIPTLHRTIVKALFETKGDILVFLPGKGEISAAIESVAAEVNPNDIALLPLWGGLTSLSQDETLQPDSKGRRKIVFSTNIAETSLTIEGVSCVIDSGLARYSLFDPSSGMSRLETGFVSLASADQRKGRAGRLQEGYCYRLWTPSQHHSLVPYYEPEINQTDLSGLCLELAQWGVKSLDELQWLTVPPVAHYSQARALLTDIGLISQAGTLTKSGVRAMKLGVHPRLARMIIEGVGLGLGSLACDIASLMAERDVLINHHSSDLVIRLMALQDYRADRRQAKKQYRFNLPAIEQSIQNSRNWKRRLDVANTSERYSLADLSDHCGLLLAYAYPDRIAKRRKGDSGRYQMANGKGALVKEGDAIGQSEWIVIGHLDGQRREGKIYLATEVTFQQVTDAFPDQVKTESQYVYDQAKNEIIGREQSTFGKIILSTCNLKNPDQEKLSACLMQAIIDTQFKVLPWSKKSEALLTRIRWLASYNSDFPLLSLEWLKDNVSEWLMPYINDVTSIKGLQKLNLVEILKNVLGWDLQQTLDAQAPVLYVSPSGKEVPIAYSETRDPFVSIVLQEVFGEVESPKLANGKKVITFELLSPARRPIQITGDLKNFWHTSYHEVAKEMRGKYPKHRWPDEPMKALPGKSIKRKL